MMYGHVEEPADWVRHILLLRSIQKRTGGFTEFVPLGFIHEKTRLYKHGGARAGATGGYVRSSKPQKVEGDQRGHDDWLAIFREADLSGN